jgi:hypothetical protein
MCCRGPLAESGDRLEDVVGGFFPAERSWGSVVLGDEGSDGVFQFLDAATTVGTSNFLVGSLTVVALVDLDQPPGVDAPALAQ